ncbi:MAG: hypothetical protein Fur0042_08350 [Cyanophyceae cyanobacterium]
MLCIAIAAVTRSSGPLPLWFSGARVEGWRTPDAPAPLTIIPLYAKGAIKPVAVGPQSLILS